MKTTIFYFSGTGNSLAVARKLGSLIDGAEVVPIVRVMKSQISNVNGDCIGLVFPVYCQDAPEVVKEFVSRLTVNQDAYIFSVATSNAVPGNTLFMLDRILRNKGLRLSAGFNIDMPGNYVAFVDYSNPSDVRAKRLEEAENAIQKIVQYVQKRNIQGAYPYKLTSRLKGSVNKFILGKLYRGERRFHTDARCIRCGTCVRVCPQSNITMTETGIAWGASCYQCLACLHWCPAASIQNGSKTKNRLRYHHPEIAAKDIIAQKQ